MIERLLRGEKTLERAYFRKFKPEVDWQWMLVVGVVIGAFISALLGGTFDLSFHGERWVETFGDDILTRIVVALAGGVVIGIGARWAGGCTSGHGISGSLQLAVSSWIAAICFFAGGIAVAMILYGMI